ncbi:MAG: DNA methyltransferase [Crinalium sp.]
MLSSQLNKIILGDAIDVLKQLPDKSIDAIITDPPYGIGLDKWDKAIDIKEFVNQVKRVTTKFYAFFGQMPTLVDWLVEADNNFHYLEHISWVKRNAVPVNSQRLQRTHETIFIYATGKQKTFYTARGLYQDVKLGGVLVDVCTLQSVHSYISQLHRWIKTGHQPQRSSLSGKSQEAFGRLNFGSKTTLDCNFTNVWSFLPPSKQPGRAGKSDYLHPTEKPLEVIKRLVEMCSQEGDIILDPFMGSGTTAIACLELGRNYIGVEKTEKYLAVANKRIDNWHSREVSNGS